MAGSPPIADCHAHIFTNAMPLSPDAWARPAYEFTTEDFLATLDRNGVAFGVIAAATLYGDYCDYTMEALSAHRRLRATIIVDPAIDPAQLRRMADVGAVGVRLGVRRAKVVPDLASPEYRTLFARLADLGLHVELLAQSSQMPTLLPPLIEAGVNLVIDHLGLPDEPEGAQAPGFEALLRAMDNGRTWVKLSASFRTDWQVVQACAARFLAGAGPERLLWGSDAPFVGHERDTDYADALRRFEALVPDPDQRRIIGETAVKLFFS